MGVQDQIRILSKNIEDYKKGIRESLDAGYKVLEDGGSALDAV